MWEWLVFMIIMAVGQFSPGPDMILLTRTALAEGKRAGCWTALGIASGLGIHALIAVTGVASIVAQGGWLETVMRTLAAIYLVWLAFQLIQSSMNPSVDQTIDPGGLAEFGCVGHWKRGLLCNLLNPKVAIFLAGVTAPFLLKHKGWQWPVILWSTIVIGGFSLWCLWVCLLQHASIKLKYQRVARWFDLIFGFALLAIALVLISGIFSVKFAV